MFIFNLVTRDNTVRFERNIGNHKVEPDNKILFIKTIREAFGCGLKDAKDFCDIMIAEMNKLTPDVNHIRNKITDEISKMHNVNDMYDILRFARTINDHPRMGTFSEDGNYKPTAELPY